MHKLYTAITEAYVEKAVKKINEIERRRHSLPNIHLSEIEFDTFVAIA